MRFLVLCVLLAGAFASNDNWESNSDICKLPPRKGFCRGHMRRFFFNKRSGKCERFVYGGCGGNANNFKSKAKCLSVCGDRANQVCGENERFNECGSACPLTCDNYYNPPEICPAMCVIGCECEEGFVRRSDGRCVCPDHCPNRQDEACGENERFNECGSACPLTCDNYDNPPEACPAMCVIGCECEKGFVRRSDGKCVCPDHCPNRQADDCDKAPETGVCRASFPRYYYDQVTGQCKKFIYGGCGGNRNNFQTKEECYGICGDMLS